MNIGKPGPFQIIESEGSGNVEFPAASPRRRYSCPHYQLCLNLAAALNWDNFTCRGCSGEVDKALYWRARHSLRADSIGKSICYIPDIRYLSAIEGDDYTEPLIVMDEIESPERPINGPQTEEIEECSPTLPIRR